MSSTHLNNDMSLCGTYDASNRLICGSVLLTHLLALFGGIILADELVWNVLNNKEVYFLVKIDVIFHCIFLLSWLFDHSKNEPDTSSMHKQLTDNNSCISNILNSVSFPPSPAWWKVLVEVTRTGYDEIISDGASYLTICFSVHGMYLDWSITGLIMID